jgi:hypothetical protein
MRRFIKAVIIGYVVLWIADSVKSALGNDEIKTMDDVKRFLRDKL